MFAISVALRVVPDLAVLVAVGKPGDRSQRPSFGDFLAGVIEFLAPDPVDGRGSFERFRRQHRGVGADKADPGFRPLLFDGFRHLAVVLQGGRGGVNDDVVVIPGSAQALPDADAVRGAIQQLGAGDQRGRLRQPGRIPETGDLPARLVARAGAAIKTVERRAATGKGCSLCQHLRQR